MHELSIAMNIVEIAEEEAQKAGSTKIKKIELAVGKLSGVVYEALDFALKEAVKNSMLEEAEILIHEIEGESKCLKCYHIFATENIFDICPKCNHTQCETIQGKELKINSLFVD
ncbi:MAG: hydrogenase maturation nickel metallochaperone HypA [Bacteroidetes bacterium]|jgi:hydrogenase nickel incorporation protein HypA/HybF|nr:hydrogenase maturation nickel metallochaperone HypA [Bacteroidota bacterium]MBT5528194.1 hydrogenase maturation nickel metallochaperone HypA [Cytophagia bacterium]MBT3422955.1 hydrogenase maturation nickel metallochaperone HypA [Bacteroidota bacterium]MBT3801696.1 hydrogenase maturation nickel metallochaperone HypA [Bacteroidota bacterium]MBT3935576.1 hydrogenase maturation nickel metallochaperone HypA [Bacteroidota bacterium]